MTRIQKRAETLVVKWTTSLFTSRGVEPVMSSQSASNKTVFNLQYSIQNFVILNIYFSPSFLTLSVLKLLFKSTFFELDSVLHKIYL